MLNSLSNHIAQRCCVILGLPVPSWPDSILASHPAQPKFQIAPALHTVGESPELTSKPGSRSFVNKRYILQSTVCPNSRARAMQSSRIRNTMWQAEGVHSTVSSRRITVQIQSTVRAQAANCHWQWMMKDHLGSYRGLKINAFVNK